MKKSKKPFGTLKGVFAAAALLSSTALATAEETIKVGILHSLSGTMAISETTPRFRLESGDVHRGFEVSLVTGLVRSTDRD